MSLLLGGGVGGGHMREIKIPQQDFALKMQGGLICRTLRYIHRFRSPLFCVIHKNQIFIQCVTSLLFL